MNDDTSMWVVLATVALLIAILLGAVRAEQVTAGKACLKYEPTLTKPQHEKCKEDLLTGP